MESFDAAPRLEPDDTRTLNNKGGVLLLTRSYTEALDIFERCVGVTPEVAQYHSDRGRARASLERYQEAVDAFDKALALDRKGGPTWKYKGLALFKSGRQSALACYNDAIDTGMEDRSSGPPKAERWRSWSATRTRWKTTRGPSQRRQGCLALGPPRSVCTPSRGTSSGRGRHRPFVEARPQSRRAGIAGPP